MSDIDRRDDRGPFDIIGDVHGCAGELEALLIRLGYQVSWSKSAPERHVSVAPPEGRKAVFVGDLVNRGPDTPDVLRIVMSMMRDGTALCVKGNHEVKLARRLRGAGHRPDPTLDPGIAAIDAAGPDFRSAVLAFVASLPCHLWLDDGRLAVAHAGILHEMLGQDTGAVEAFCLYGPSTGRIDADGKPLRVDWAAAYRGATAIVCGHTPMQSTRWVNNTLCIDTGCVAGNRLTALRWPERETVDVTAQRIWSPAKRPLIDPDAAEPQP